MSVDQIDILEISGSDSIELSAGEVIETVTGSILVFALTEDGRRLPMATIPAGNVVVGCSPTQAGDRLLVTGMIGSQIRRHGLAEFVQSHGLPPLEKWVVALGGLSQAGRWVDRVLAPGEEPIRLAPGENVVTTTESVPSANTSILGWLRVTSGTARFCGWRGVEVGEFDPPVPLTRGTWLTSAMRCWIGEGSAPSTIAEWESSLDLMGRLGVQTAVAQQHETDRARQARLMIAESRSVRDAQDGIDLMIGAVTRPVLRSAASTDRESSMFAAAVIAARATGLTLTEDSRVCAIDQITSGRDPIQAAAEACTARARGIDLTDEWWLQEGTPFIAQVKRGTAVAVIWRGRSWAAVDPETPDMSKPVDREFAETLERRATQLIPVLPPEPSTMRSLGRISITGSGRDITYLLVLTLMLAVVAFITPYAFGQIAGSFGRITTRGLLTVLVTLALFLVVTATWEYVRGLSLLRMRVSALAVATGTVWDRMMRMRVTWHDNFTLGERMTQSTSVMSASSQVQDFVVTGMLDTVTVLGSLAAVATTNISLLLAVTLLIVVQLFVNFRITRKVANLTMDRTEQLAGANGRLMETIRAVTRLRVSGAEDRAYRRWATLHAELSRVSTALLKMVNVQRIVIGAWPLIGLIVIVAVTSASGASFGDFVTAQTAATIASTTVTMTAFASSDMLNARAELSRIEPVLAEIPEGFGVGVNPGALSGAFSVNDLVFRYSPGGATVLNKVSFDVHPGEQVAIVGPSGCGKTTLMRMLLGLERPESGVVTVDGHDLASLDQPSVRRQIGCVLQSATLLPGTIRDNIDMGRGLSSTQMWAALEAASVADDIRAMSAGLNTYVADGGGTVSGGQRQRILIARALAGNPRMLILDEATSALDNVTQGIIIEFLEKQRLTRLVVAHRLSTIKTADRIIVLAGGTVAQQGTYDSLMAEQGHFRDLALRQLA